MDNENILIVAPLNLTGTNQTSTSNALNWDNIADATSYKIYRSLNENENFALIATVTTNSYIDNNLNPNTTYYYRVTAIDAANNESTPSNTIGVSTVATDQETPISLTARPISQSEIALNWNAMNNVKTYSVYRSNAETGPFNQIGTTENTTYLDTNLEPNTTYYYRVVYNNQNVNSPQIPTAMATTLTNPPIQINPIATPRSCSAINITWSYVDNAQGYYIYQSNSYNGPFTLVGLATGNQFIMNNLQNNTTYYYRVAAYFSNGQVITSNVVSARTLAECPVCCRRVCYIRGCGNNLYRCCKMCQPRCVCCDY